MNFENIKVLVIDDNQSMQTLFKAIIKKYFQSDIESLFLVKMQKSIYIIITIDIVFIDYYLPDMKGTEIITDEVLNKFKVILMSANDIEINNKISFLKKTN